MAAGYDRRFAIYEVSRFHHIITLLVHCLLSNSLSQLIHYFSPFPTVRIS